MTRKQGKTQAQMEVLVAGKTNAIKTLTALIKLRTAEGMSEAENDLFWRLAGDLFSDHIMVTGPAIKAMRESAETNSANAQTMRGKAMRDDLFETLGKVAAMAWKRGEPATRAWKGRFNKAGGYQWRTVANYLEGWGYSEADIKQWLTDWRPPANPE